MAEKKLKQKGVATFEGFQIAKNNTVTLKFKLRYDEIVTSVNLLQGLNTDITIHAKVPNKKAVNLGMFKIGSVNFDKDGNTLVPFKSLVDSVNLDNICSLVDEEYIQLRFLAVLELPDNEATEETEKGESEEWED
jgi:hypothetical protein